MVQHPTDKQFSWTLRTGAFSAFILTVRRAVRKGHAMSIRRNIQEEVKKKKKGKQVGNLHSNIKILLQYMQGRQSY